MKDHMYTRAKEDVMRMVELLQSNGEHDDVARTRVPVLGDYL